MAPAQPTRQSRGKVVAWTTATTLPLGAIAAGYYAQQRDSRHDERIEARVSNVEIRQQDMRETLAEMSSDVKWIVKQLEGRK